MAGERDRAAVGARVGPPLQLAVGGGVSGDRRRRIRCAPGRRRRRRSMRTRRSCACASDSASLRTMRGSPRSSASALEQQLEPLVERARERVDLARPAPVAERGRDRRERRGERAAAGSARGDRDRARERQLEARLRDLARRGEARSRGPATDTRMPTPSSLVQSTRSTCPPLTRSCSAVRADPARLGVLAAPRGARDQVAQELEWRQPVAPRRPGGTGRAGRSRRGGRAARGCQTEQVDDEDQRRVRGDRSRWPGSCRRAPAG